MVMRHPHYWEWSWLPGIIHWLMFWDACTNTMGAVMPVLVTLHCIDFVGDGNNNAEKTTIWLFVTSCDLQQTIGMDQSLQIKSALRVFSTIKVKSTYSALHRRCGNRTIYNNCASLSTKSSWVNCPAWNNKINRLYAMYAARTCLMFPWLSQPADCQRNNERFGYTVTNNFQCNNPPLALTWCPSYLTTGLPYTNSYSGYR